jgi:hypothetical protein
LTSFTSSPARRREYAATVRLQGDRDTLDLALLEVAGKSVRVPTFAYAAISRSEAGEVQDCWAVGFPRFKEGAHDPAPLRPSVQVSGTIPLGENLDQQLLTLLVTRTPRPILGTAVPESEWAGMSGAVVFAGRTTIIGVITEHHLPEGESALTVVPITALDQLPAADAQRWWTALTVNRAAFLCLPTPAARAGNTGAERGVSTPPANANIAVLTARLDTLLPLLEQITWPRQAILRSFRATLVRNPWWEVPAGTLPELIQRLVTAGEVLHLLEYIARLAALPLARTIGDEMSQWVEETARDVRLPSEQLAAIQRRVLDSGDAQALFLTVRLRPHGSEHYALRSWLRRGRAADAEPILDEQLVTLAQAESTLNDIRDAILGDLLRANNQLVMEFILPYDLLTQTVDQWRIRVGVMMTSVGAKFEVVVRASDRFYDKQLESTWPDWRVRWDRYKHASLVSGPDPIEWVRSPQECDQETLYGRLANETKLCLALAVVPPAPDSTHGDVLAALLSAGTPIAIWARQGNGIDIERELRRLVSARLLPKLPRLVRNLRQASTSVAGAAQLGQHLTLFWDDADRLPPDAKPFASVARLRRTS